MSYQDLVLSHLKEHTRLLSLISANLQNNAPLSPSYRRRLREFSGFNWLSIGAVVVAEDEEGPVEVEWNNHRFDRTIGNSYGSDFIIFSRPRPEWSQQNKVYFTLIRFADYNKTPLNQSATAPTPKASGGPGKPPNLQVVKPSHTPPAIAAQSEVRADPDAPDPRETFYNVAAAVMQADSSKYELVNRLTKLAGIDGFAVALQQLQAAVS